MRLRASAAAIVAVLVSAGPAHAQGTVSLFSVGGKVISQTDIPVSTTGELVVSFHGDPATGCASAGLCGYSGTVVVRPGSGDIVWAKYRHGRHTGEEASLNLGLGLEQATTFVHVARSAGGGVSGVCGDAEQPALGLGALDISGRMATISLLQSTGLSLATRCAGPVDQDLAAIGPRLTIPVSAMLRGRTRLSLTTSAPFSSHGFAGTISSSIVLRLASPQSENTSPISSQFPPGIKTERVRIVNEELPGVTGAGTLTARLAGTTDPTECELLDSCGLGGTLTLSPGFAHLTGFLTVTGPAKRPYRDFVAALGVGRGNPRGIQVFGSIDWEQSGTAVANLSQSGTCADSAPLGPGEIILASRGANLAAAYDPLSATRTRCPGPVISLGQSLASGSIPVSRLGRSSFTITLNRGSSFSDDGYRGTTSGGLTVTLRRGRITQQVLTEPAGF